MAEVIEATAQAQNEAAQAPAEAPPKPKRTPRKPAASAADTSEAQSPTAETAQAPTQADPQPQAEAKPRDGARRNRDQQPFEPWYVKREKERLQRMSKQSMPFLKQSLKLQTRHAQEMYERAHELWSETVITLSVTMRNFKREEECLTVDAEVDRLLGICADFMNQEMTRLKTVADNNGVDLDGATDVEYTHPIKYDLQITSPRERRFHELLLLLDKLCICLDMLWMATLITDRARSKSAYDAKSLLLRTCGKARNLVFRAQASSQRNGIHNAADPRKGTQLDPGAAPAAAPANDAVADSAAAPAAEAEAGAEAELAVA